MSPFYRPISGRMVGGCEADLHVESLHDVTIEVGDEGVPVVRDGDGGDPVPGHPAHEGGAAVS